MIYNLKSIKRDIQSVAEAIGNAFDVEVVIVDKEYYVVGGTKRYKSIIGTYLDDCYYVTKEVFRRKENILLDNPGNSDLCKLCNKYLNCSDTIEINAPIFLKEDVIGSISIVGLNNDQKIKLSAISQQILNFISTMGDLITSKILEQLKSNQLYNEKLKYELLVNSVHEGIISVGKDELITHINTSAEQILHINKNDYINKHISTFLPETNFREGILKVIKTGESLENYEVESKSYSFIMTIRSLQDKTEIKGAVITIRKLSEVRKQAISLFNQQTEINFSDIIGENVELKRSIKISKSVANSDSNILIYGESGVGKELFVRSIHNASYRRENPFLSINCAAIPEGLIESELFGYEAGAFTGASKKGKPGKLELANGGTLFLDEIGEMPIYLQSKLLRILQDDLVYRIGGTKPIAIDIRFIAATNKDLHQSIEDGKFREDLYYRIAVIPINIIPLRKRKDDIPVLIDFFLNKFKKTFNKPSIIITNEAYKALINHDWPGNIRELENTIEYSVNVCEGDVIDIVDLPKKFLKVDTIVGIDTNLKKHRTENEAVLINELIKIHGTSVNAKKNIAERLGISLSSLYRILSKNQ